MKSGSAILNGRGKFDELLSCDSWSECHMILLIATEIHYNLFSERKGDLVSLWLHNY